MQSAYENRVADLQLSYDEINGSLVSAEDSFKATADELQTKQDTIRRFIDRKRQVDALVSNPDSTLLGPPSSASGNDSDAAPSASGGGCLVRYRYIGRQRHRRLDTFRHAATGTATAAYGEADPRRIVGPRRCCRTYHRDPFWQSYAKVA